MKSWPAGILLAAIWAAALWITLTPEVAGGHGAVHSRFSQMDQGGGGLERHGPVFAAAWLLGSVMIAMFVSLLAWQTRGGRRSWPLFLVGGAVYEAVFSMMCWTYWHSLADPLEASFWGSFPVPVAWLVYGIWLFPGFFITMYVMRFDEWILPEASTRRFEELLKARQQS
ncbi:MAG: hypothetical protein O3A53_15020 [Acidobacteria bacterium]|nr:hypothetical protein [Acidobacteriota bacterium]MDA1236098.1 hypothetical protein [Acidobacteriota bacterium]